MLDINQNSCNNGLTFNKQGDIMKSKAYQVKVTKIGLLSKSESMLCNNRGKTIVCLATAKKWAKEYEQKFIRTNHDMRQVLIQVIPY